MKKYCTILLLTAVAVCSSKGNVGDNLISNPDFEKRSGNGPTGFELTGGSEYRYLGLYRKVSSSHGVGLSSDHPSGAISCVVKDLESKQGKWFRFAFRGLPQENFAVGNDDLYVKVEFFGEHGKISYDAKQKKIYDQVQTLRRDMTINGVRHQHGSEVWRNYVVDFSLPFPQVDQLRLSIGFGHGAASTSTNAEFLVDDVSLVHIQDPPNVPPSDGCPIAIVPSGKLLSIGGRWFYAAREGETAIPKMFNFSNVDRLIYRDCIYSAPFAGNTSAWLREGSLGADGKLVEVDRLIPENVIIQFEAGTMTITTHGIPNHPTGRFPERGFGNPNYITEQVRSFYFPITPAENSPHVSLVADNDNHALPMGPIGLAVNGVVFFNPFDMQRQDATDLMDPCCGHPAPNGQYHYHKYPICVNSPWADDGKAHSPLLGWAFDGFPVYGPYEGANVMAKDLIGNRALNEFNGHFDEERGFHYHVTPGKFPYIIGGYWGTRDARDGGPRGQLAGTGGPQGPGNRPGDPRGTGGPAGVGIEPRVSPRQP